MSDMMFEPINKQKTFMVIVGPSHAGKYLLLYPFQHEPSFGISDYYHWPNTLIHKFFKDAVNIDLGDPINAGALPQLNNLIYQNFNITPEITAYFKDPIDANYYYVLVNSQFMDTIPKRLNNPFHIYLPMIRDPRILWIVDRSTNDKNDSKFTRFFFEGMGTFTEAYLRYIRDKNRVALVIFEDLIADYENVLRNTALKFVKDYDPDLPLKRPSEQVNKFFTTDDRDNNVWFGYKDQKALDLVSDVCRDYIKLFGYKEKLTVDEIYEGI